MFANLKALLIGLTTTSDTVLHTVLHSLKLGVAAFLLPVTRAAYFCFSRQNESRDIRRNKRLKIGGSQKQPVFKFLASLFIMLCVGCASTPHPERVTSLEYGEAPEDTVSVVRQHFHGILKDPMSAMYRVDPKTRKVYAYNQFDPNNTRLAVWGWMITGKVNSKNSYGGYVGWRDFYMIYRHGYIYQSSTSRKAPHNYEVVP